MGRKSWGGNESERRFGLERPKLQRPSSLPEGEGSMDRRKLTDAPVTLAGLKRQHDGKGIRSNWRDPPRPDAKAAEQGSHITGDTGKVVEDEREWEGSIGAGGRGNLRGAKRPCCLQ